MPDKKWYIRNEKINEMMAAKKKEKKEAFTVVRLGGGEQLGNEKSASKRMIACLFLTHTHTHSHRIPKQKNISWNIL